MTIVGIVTCTVSSTGTGNAWYEIHLNEVDSIVNNLLSMFQNKHCMICAKKKGKKRLYIKIKGL